MVREEGRTEGTYVHSEEVVGRRRGVVRFGFGVGFLKTVYAESLVDGERLRHLAGNPG
jgi:hypothetical protein